MSGWPTASLGDVVDVRIGPFGSLLHKEDYTEDGVPLVNPMHIDRGSIVSDRRHSVKEEKAAELAGYRMLPGDVVLGRRGEMGRCAVVQPAESGFLCGTGSLFLRPDERVSPEFLAKLMSSPDMVRLLERESLGTTMPNLNRTIVSNIQIALPPIEEQRRIAAILEHADALRAKRREALAHLDDLTQSIFIDMFGDPLRNPRGWDRAPLADVVGSIIDCPHSTPKWTEVGEICLRTSNLLEGEWDWTDTRFVSVDTYHERSRRGYLEPGDIVLSREGTVGIAAIVPPEPRLCMGQRLVQIKPATVLLPQYLLRVLLFELAPERIARVMIGSTSSHLNVKELRALLVSVPPMKAQSSFARRMASIDKVKAEHRTALAELDALFASLQSRAFRGEL
ncbi:restriction endonuclease subunit S [Nocardia vinacea]|uniref:restriction endonuclease subunit S n=1 Tax=Nocardia vinacea TaxID=96468 RepID=UPI003435291E